MNRRLTPDELATARELLHDIRQRVDALGGGDANLRFAYNRKVHIALKDDERGTAMQRKKLKAQKRKEQGDLCAACAKPLPLPYAVLDRLDAMLGYTAVNTRLIHPDCDYQAQQAKKYT